MTGINFYGLATFAIDVGDLPVAIAEMTRGPLLFMP